MAEAKKVTRITATDDAPKKASKPAKVVKSKAVAESTDKKNVFVRIGDYFKGAWYELRQVRWPNRRATWALTIAVVLFSVFFVVLIVLLDTFFKWIFELIIT
ncbi:MAG: preprotein translocase subunit SecE [Candidatus Saccharimonadaceae bacterium]